MIYNNGLSSTKQTQSKSAELPADIQQSLSQLQSLPAFQTNSSPLMQNLLHLVQTLVQQLQKELQENEPDNKKEHNKQQSKPPIFIHHHIVGTDGDDQLKGTYCNDHILGLDGNDRLYGRQGNDLLSGGNGNDRLYGGRGNDRLDGGQGNDRLFGGRGNDVLFGGQGDDVLVSRFGSDFLDGGSGKDKARIKGNIDDYNFKITTIFPRPLHPGDAVILGAPTNNGIVLTHKETGQTISVVNIETFKFNDIQLSTDELRKRIENQNPNEIPLDKTQHRHALDLFNYIASGNEKVRLLDQDGNGKISVGDIAMLDSQQYILDEAAVRQITEHPKGEQLKLNNTQKEQALALFDTPVSRSINYFVEIFDSNGDGKVSKGDTAILMKSPSVVPAILGYHSSKIEVERINLTEKQAAEINDTPAPQLKLTKEEYQAISNHFNHTPPKGTADGITIRFTGVALDQDGNGKLSVGDTVKLHYTGGIAGIDEIRDHVLTEKDLKAIQNAAYKELQLDGKQQQRALDLFSPFHTFGEFVRILDADGNGKVSKGDIAIHFRGPDPVPIDADESDNIELGRMILSEQQASIINGTALIDERKELNLNKEKWENTRPESYSFTLKRSGFIAGNAAKSVDLTIKGNTVIDARFSDGSKAMVPEYNQLTVEDLFKTISNAIESNAAKVEIKYNADTGMPESIFIDQSEFIADEEIYLNMSNFKNLDYQ